MCDMWMAVYGASATENPLGIIQGNFFPVYHEIFPPLENVPPGGEYFLGFPGNSPPPGGIFPRKICPSGGNIS